MDASRRVELASYVSAAFHSPNELPKLENAIWQGADRLETTESIDQAMLAASEVMEYLAYGARVRRRARQARRARRQVH